MSYLVAERRLNRRLPADVEERLRKVRASPGLAIASDSRRRLPGSIDLFAVFASRPGFSTRTDACNSLDRYPKQDHFRMRRGVVIDHLDRGKGREPKQQLPVCLQPVARVSNLLIASVNHHTEPVEVIGNAVDLKPGPGASRQCLDFVPWQ